MTFEYYFPVIFMGNLKEIIKGKLLCPTFRAMSLTKSFSSSVIRITRERQREEEDAERGEPSDISTQMNEQNSNSHPTLPIICGGTGWAQLGHGPKGCYQASGFEKMKESRVSISAAIFQQQKGQPITEHLGGLESTYK